MPKKQKIKRPAQGFKPPSPKPPADPLIVESPYFLAGTIGAVLSPADCRKLLNLLNGKRVFTKTFTARDGIGKVVACSDGDDFWLQLR